MRRGGNGNVCSDALPARLRPRHFHSFLGSLDLLALFVSCLLTWKAIEWLRNRRKFDGVAVEGRHTKDHEYPAYAPTLADRWHGDHRTDIASMTQHETEEFLLIYGTRKQRKAIKERQKGRRASAEAERVSASDHLKRVHLAAHPDISISYWTTNHDTCSAECRADWVFDDEGRTAGWNMFKNRPHPSATTRR